MSSRLFATVIGLAALGACTPSPAPADGRGDSGTSADVSTASVSESAGAAPQAGTAAATVTVEFTTARASLALPASWTFDTKEGWARAEQNGVRVEDATGAKGMDTEAGFQARLDALEFDTIRKLEASAPGPLVGDSDKEIKMPHRAKPIEKLEGGGWARFVAADDHVHVDVMKPRPSGKGWVHARCRATSAEAELARRTCLSLRPSE